MRLVVKCLRGGLSSSLYEGAPTFMASFVTFAARLHKICQIFHFQTFLKMKLDNEKKEAQFTFETIKHVRWLPIWFIGKFEGSICISSVNWGWKLEHFLSFWEVMLGGGSQALTDRKEQNHWSRIQNSSHYMDSSTPHLITQAQKSNTGITSPPFSISFLVIGGQVFYLRFCTFLQKFQKIKRTPIGDLSC